MYHSAYLAELHDFFYDSFDSSNGDANTYLDAYKEMRAGRPLNGPEDEFIFVDIACGTGRVFRELANNLVQCGEPSDSTQFIGLDYSAHMLKRAIEQMPESLSHSIKYVQGSAMELSAMKEFQGPPTVDLMIISGGSITTLGGGSGQAEKFLAQAAGVLRPETGRLLISVLYMYDDSRKAETAKMMEQMTENPFSQDTKSVLFPGILYRPGQENCRQEGNLLYWDIPVEVIKKDEKGVESVIEKDVASVGGRVWQDGEVPLLAAAAGLELVETRFNSNETAYVLKKA
jgi:ubiquinone/menaquinone biosynthesis C-methylase UbiE